MGLRGIIKMGLRPKPPPATRGDPFAPLRGLRAAPCAAWGRLLPCSPSPSVLRRYPGYRPLCCLGLGGIIKMGLRGSHRWGYAPNPRRPLAGTPAPHSVAGGPRRGHFPIGAAPQTLAGHSRGPFAPLRGRRAAPCAAWGRLLPCSPSPSVLRRYPGYRPLCCLGLGGIIKMGLRGFHRWGCAPSPRQALEGTPLPRAGLAGPRCARPAPTGARV